MSFIRASDPLALVAIRGGRIGTPAEEQGASAGFNLDTQQRAIQIGEPVPIVFGRRRGGAGGIFISPGATEARFENDENNAVTAYYHLVLSEGEIDPIAVKDVFQRSCRVGSHTQTYNRRAGSWTPGNFIVQREGYTKPECPYYCGTVGVYPDMSTLSHQMTYPDGLDFWDRQVHVFIRGGMHVTRLHDATLGPSDNLADLVQWLLVKSARVPSSMIDTSALSAAATFLEANNFTCNCWLQESRNYSDLLADWAPYFLLCESNSSGKRGLRTLLPVNANGTLNTGAISYEYEFNEDLILPGSLEIEYTSLADRVPIVVQLTWRQELDDDMAIIRTAEVRYNGTAANGPYESHDLSAFCTRENHAVKIGAYILAKRRYTSHTIRFTARPQAHNRILIPGDIVRVKLLRQASGSAPSYHDYLYQVERITKTLAGDVAYECVHFPVNSEGKSLITLDVAAATGSGILLTSDKTGDGCDINSSTDNTIPDEDFTIGEFPDFEVTLPNFELEDVPLDELGGGGGSDFGDATPLGPMGGTPGPGSTVSPPAGTCENPVVTRVIRNLNDPDTVVRDVGGAELYTIPLTPPEELGGTDYNGKSIEYYFSCPSGEEQKADPIVSPLGPCFELPNTDGITLTGFYSETGQVKITHTGGPVYRWSQPSGVCTETLWYTVAANTSGVTVTGVQDMRIRENAFPSDICGGYRQVYVEVQNSSGSWISIYSIISSSITISRFEVEFNFEVVSGDSLPIRKCS